MPGIHQKVTHDYIFTMATHSGRHSLTFQIDRQEQTFPRPAKGQRNAVGDEWHVLQALWSRKDI